MVEAEGNIYTQSISNLIYPILTHSYVSPKSVETCAFQKTEHSKSFQLQLVVGTKRIGCGGGEMSIRDGWNLHMGKFKCCSTFFL